MTDDERSPDPHDVPGFNRAVGVDDPVLDAEYGDQESAQNDVLPMAGIRPSTTSTVHSLRQNMNCSNSKHNSRSHCRLPTRSEN